ncbi:MAG: FAD binding domain-containing protein, partial [Acidimicrobiia bacterium]|nr:FAD binding domain-containing protein [Acidimicrobiia bacterium]
MHEVQRHTLSIGRVESPATIDEALDLLARHGDRARAIAGGTDLLLELDRGTRPGVDVLIDLSRIPGLDTITEAEGRIRLGPLVTHNDVLRNRATVVGNLVTASPANDTITPLRVLDAHLDLRSVDGDRTVSLAAFHTGVRRTLLEPGELVVGVRFRPLDEDERAVFLKLGNRRAQAISVVHLTAAVKFDGDRVVSARLALGSVAPTIVEVDTADLVGSPLDDETIERLASRAAESVTPIDDVRATGEYRTASIP